MTEQNNLTNTIRHIVKIFILLFLLQNYAFCNTELPITKCELEKKKRQDCILTNFAICELTDERRRYERQGINICTNPDGFLFALIGICDRYLSYECGGLRNNRSNR